MHLQYLLTNKRPSGAATNTHTHDQDGHGGNVTRQIDGARVMATTILVWFGDCELEKRNACVLVERIFLGNHWSVVHNDNSFKFQM